MTGSVGYSRTQLITRYTNSDADMLTSSARTTSGHACAKCASGFRPCAWQRSNAALIDIRHRLCAQTATMHASANLPTARPVRPASPLRNPEGRATGKTPPTPSALLPFRPRGQRCPVGRIPYTVHMLFCAVCRNRPQRPVQAIMPLLSFPRSEKWRKESSFLSGGKISPNSASLTTDEKGCAFSSPNRRFLTKTSQGIPLSAERPHSAPRYRDRFPLLSKNRQPRLRDRR